MCTEIRQTGFEFKKRRAFPVISGVVVASENEEMLLEVRLFISDIILPQYCHVIRNIADDLIFHQGILGCRTRGRGETAYETTRASHQTMATAYSRAKNSSTSSGPVLRKGIAAFPTYRGSRTGQSPIEIYTPLLSTEILQQHGVEEAGGFLNTADDVVQPYTLPRNLHPVLDSSQQPPPNTQEASVDAGPSKQDGVGHMSSTAAAHRQLHMETFDIEDTHSTIPNASADVPPPTPITGAPKTMRELAEAVAVDGQQRSEPDAAIETFVTPMHSSRVASPAPATSNGHAERPNATRHAVGASNGKDKATVAARLSTKETPRRGRKRNREETVTDSEDEGDDDKDDRDSRDDSTTKRSRRTAKRPPPAPVPKSDRVLRTRKSKTADRLQEEKEQEAAYRRAVA